MQWRRCCVAPFANLVLFWLHPTEHQGHFLVGGSRLSTGITEAQPRTEENCFICSLALQRQTVAGSIGSALPQTCPFSPCFVFEDSERSLSITCLQCNVFLEVSCSCIELESVFTQQRVTAYGILHSYFQPKTSAFVKPHVLPVLSLSSGHVNNWGQDLGYSAFQGKGCVLPLFKN